MLDEVASLALGFLIPLSGVNEASTESGFARIRTPFVEISRSTTASKGSGERKRICKNNLSFVVG